MNWIFRHNRFWNFQFPILEFGWLTIDFDDFWKFFHRKNLMIDSFKHWDVGSAILSLEPEKCQQKDLGQRERVQSWNKTV